MELLPYMLGSLAVFIVAWKSLSMPSLAVEHPVQQKAGLLGSLSPILRGLASPLRGLIGARYRKWMQSKIDAAGLRARLTVDELFALHFVLAGFAWLLTGIYPPAVRWSIIGFAILFPELWLISIISDRHVKIRRVMPYFTDLLAMCTGAGLDFGAAIDRVLSQSPTGPLADEFRLARRDNELGRSQQESFMNMAARVQLPELSSFVAIITQAIHMGASVTNILEAQAEKMRIERYEMAERLGAQAQQKILLPLMLLILPAFVLLGILPLIYVMARPIIDSLFF